MTRDKTPGSDTVLACIDGSPISAAVCDYAAWISQRLSAPLKLLHNIEHPRSAAMTDLSGSIGFGAQEELLEELATLEQQKSKLMLKQGKLMLQAALERVQAAGAGSAETVQRHGSLTETLIEWEESIGVLVMGIRGEDHEGDSRHLGAHLESVIRSLHKPILVANADFVAPQSFMLAYDGSEAAGKALDMVLRSDLLRGLPCHLVHVGRSGAVLAEAEGQLLEAGFDLTVSPLQGHVDDALVAYQLEQGVDLMVMGAFGHTRIRELVLGSFTSKMLHHTQKPLLLLR
ncbi:MAG: universal stress protein [Pseudomonadota bacterium]